MGTSEATISLGERAALAFTAYRDGDDHALGRLVDLVTPLLWQVSRAHGCDGHMAEDVVQTTWLKLVDHVDQIREPRAVLGWLVISVKRESWRVSRAARRTSFDETGTVDPGETEEDPESLLVLTERQRLLWSHVDALGERCRQLLRIVAFCDRPDYDQVSSALGMPRGSIGPTRGRCLDKLRRSLVADPHYGEV